MMWDGKKSTAENIFYDAMKKLESKGGDEALKLFEEGVERLRAARERLTAAEAKVKQVLADQYATSFEGGKTFADALSYAHLKPSFKGYDEFTTTLQEELDTNVFNNPNKTAKDALASVVPALNALLAGGQ